MIHFKGVGFLNCQWMTTKLLAHFWNMFFIRGNDRMPWLFKMKILRMSFFHIYLDVIQFKFQSIFCFCKHPFVWWNPKICLKCYFDARFLNTLYWKKETSFECLMQLLDTFLLLRTQTTSSLPGLPKHYIQTWKSRKYRQEIFLCIRNEDIKLFN